MPTACRVPDDQSIRQAVLKALGRSPHLDIHDMALDVEGGVATVEGYVDSYAKKYEVERAVLNVDGLRAVANELIVRLPLSRERADIDLAHAVADALQWCSGIPADRVKAKVDDGFVTLLGTVDWPYQRAAAHQATQHVDGIRGLTNSILVLHPTTSPNNEAQWRPSDMTRYGR